MTNLPAILMQAIPQTDGLHSHPAGTGAVRSSASSSCLLDPLCSTKKTARRLWAGLHFVGAVAALAATWYMSKSAGARLSPNMVRVDSFSVFFHFLVIAIAAVVILISFEYHGGAADSSRRVLRPDPVWRGRHVADVLGGRTGADLHSAGNLFDLDLHPRRIPPATSRQQRSPR